MLCGLLGRKLQHSYSPQIHKGFGNYAYNLFEVEPTNLKQFFKSQKFQGVNVTIPYKKDVLPYCDELSPIAQKLGAVNTIVRKADGKLYGHNTDYFGFQSMLKKTGLSVNGKKCLVLGSGGASSTVCAVLEELGADVVIISRNGENNYENLFLHEDASLVINTTPVGMYPNNGSKPVDIRKFPKIEGVLDLIYNPSKTQLLLDAEALGIASENGLWMLVAQAKESAELFTNSSISNEKIAEIHLILKKSMQNIVLIGMPGSGKTTLGSLLAAKTGREFIDADQKIEEQSGMKIPEIFAQYGEKTFRDMETEVLADLGKKSGIVLSTGGGCVTLARNYPLLHQNGTIIWVQRKISELSRDGRPLSQTTSLEQMYLDRKESYEKFADIVIENNNTPEQAVESLITMEDII